MTAVILASGCPGIRLQPQSATAPPVAHAAPSASVPIAIDVSNGNVANLVLSPASSVLAAAASSVNFATQPSPAATSTPSHAFNVSHAVSPPSTAASTCASPPQATLQAGFLVRIQGLQSKPEMNGRTGVVCGEFDQHSGRWTVEVDAAGASPACRGAFRAANLCLIPSHNCSTEWLDEGGHVRPKNVNFSRECAKGHALVPLGHRGGDSSAQLMCRLCHCFCGRKSQGTAGWLVCSVDPGCCGEYAVCCSCTSVTSADAVACSGCDDFNTRVSCSMERCLM